MSIPMMRIGWWFGFLCPSNLSRTKWRTIHGCLDANVAPVYPSHDLAHGWAGKHDCSKKIVLEDGRLVQELPESVNEHFLVEHASETIVQGNQITIPARGNKPCLS